MWSVYRIPKCGGPPEEVASGERRVDGIVADDTSVFFTDLGAPPDDNGGEFTYHGAVWRAEDSSPAEKIVTGVPAPRDLAVDDSDVYWLGQSRVSRAPRTGGAPEILLLDDDQWNGIDVDNLHVYWGAAGAVRKMSKSDPAAFDVLPVKLANEVIVSDNELFALDLGEAGDPNQILRVGKDGSDATLLFEGSAWPHLLLDGPWIYYGADGSAWRISTAMGDPVKLVDAAYWSEVASDEAYLYWYHDGVVRLPKPVEN